MTKSANLPAPFGGQDTLTPTAVLASPLCERLFNFNTTEAGISLRHGDGKWSYQDLNTGGGTTTEDMIGFVKFGKDELFAAVETNAGVIRYYDISVKGASPTLAYTSLNSSYTSLYATYFNKRVFTFGAGNAVGDYYDGTSWGSWGYTLPASFNPVGGCAYKNRQYFIGAQSSNYGYSEIDAVTGTVTKVQLGGVISEDSTLAIIAPFTISNQVSSETLLAFVFANGEVLFYSGSYPDAGDWGLAGRAKIGQPLGYNSSMPYQGDSLVACTTGLVSLRDMFLRGSGDALSLLITKPITPDWTDLISRFIYTNGEIAFNFRVGLAWWEIKNKIVVSFAGTSAAPSPGITQGSTFFVFDTLRGAWSVHSFAGGFPGRGSGSKLISFLDEILFDGCGSAQASPAIPGIMINSKEDADDFQDVNYDDATKSSYDFEMLGAPIPFPKTAVYEASQIEPILESDLYEGTNWEFVADFGRQSSGAGLTDALTTSVAKPAVNVGMQNITFVQVKMSGTTIADKTVGLDLYSYNVWYQSGLEASR